MTLRVQDVAAYLLAVHKDGPGHGAMEAMKVHRLCYYFQAWHLVWTKGPLFQDEIQAWGSGPVCPSLYQLHRGLYRLDSIPGGSERAISDESAQETIVIVLRGYGKMTSPDLADLSRSEDPWRRARRGIPDGIRSESPISHESLIDFYGSLGETNSDPV